METYFETIPSDVVEVILCKLKDAELLELYIKPPSESITRLLNNVTFWMKLMRYRYPDIALEFLPKNLYDYTNMTSQGAMINYMSLKKPYKLIKYTMSLFGMNIDKYIGRSYFYKLSKVTQKHVLINLFTKGINVEEILMLLLEEVDVKLYVTLRGYSVKLRYSSRVKIEISKHQMMGLLMDIYCSGSSESMFNYIERNEA